MVGGGVHGWWGVWGLRAVWYEIRSMSGRYSSYCNAFFFTCKFVANCCLCSYLFIVLNINIVINKII